MSARVVIWLGAICFAVYPLIFLVAKDKGLDIVLLLRPSEYDGLERDLCFVAIAVLVVGLVDAGEALVLALESEKPEMKKRGLRTISAMILIVLEILAFASISGAAKSADVVSRPLFYLFLSTFLIAAACRYQLLGGCEMSGDEGLLVRILTLATLATAIWIFLSTYVAWRREISKTEDFFHKHEQEQLARLSHIDQSMDGLVDVVQKRSIDGGVGMFDDVRPMFDDIIVSLKTLEKSAVEIETKKRLVFSRSAVRKINARQREIRSLAERSMLKISVLATRLYGLRGDVGDL